MAAASTSTSISAVAMRVFTGRRSLQRLSTDAYAGSGNNTPALRRLGLGSYRQFDSRVLAGVERGDVKEMRRMTGSSHNKQFSTSLRGGSRNQQGDTTSPPSPSSAKTSSTLTPPLYLDPSESEIFVKLCDGLSPTKLSVKDISGGCGSMYAIEVSSEKFRGLGVLKQQRLVNEVLGKEMVAGWHGVQIKTSVA